MHTCACVLAWVHTWHPRGRISTRVRSWPRPAAGPQQRKEWHGGAQELRNHTRLRAGQATVWPPHHALQRSKPPKSAAYGTHRYTASAKLTEAQKKMVSQRHSHGSCVLCVEVPWQS